MTFSPSRLTLCAPLALALFGAHALSAQSPFAQPYHAALTLPDAPSYSTSQQPAPQQQQVPQETDDQRKAREQREEAAREVKAQEKQRIGGVMPDFNVVMNGKAVPLTPRQKFDLSFHTIIDPYTIGLAAVIGGGYGELTDDHTGYGHGPAGYFKRTAASYADNVDGNLIGNALLPVILHQDPRYFRMGEGHPVKKRIIYSALTTFICKGDNGKNQFNTSNVLGNFISGAISNAYYPADERGVSLTIDNAIIVTLEGMLGGQLLEFSPDITEKIRRHHQRKLDEKAAAGAASQPAATPSAAPAPAPVVVQPAAPPAPSTPPQP